LGGGHDHEAEVLVAQMNTDLPKPIHISYLRGSVFICGGVLLFTLLASSGAIAQGGGKAEPNRIEFKRGTTSTTISGTVRGDEQAEYILGASKGQRLVIKLTSVPAKSSVFQLLGPDNDTLGLEFDANYDYSGTLPKTGDYFITVARPGGSKGTSRYKLTVRVR
jgi:hypothetical protein